MLITTTDLKANLEHFLEESQELDIVITKNGQPYARLSGLAHTGSLDRLLGLRGILPDTLTFDDIKEARMSAKDNHL